MNKFTERLLEEWKQHSKIVVGVDVDDTIKPWRTSTQEECDKVIRDLINAKDVGAYITIFTACNEDRFEEIKTYCKEKGLEIDSINQNPIELPYGNQNKIYANIFIDDRAGLQESLECLNEAMYRMRAYKAGKRLDNPGSTEF